MDEVGYSTELFHQESELNVSQSFGQPQCIPLTQDYSLPFHYEVFAPTLTSDELSEAETPSLQQNNQNAAFCSATGQQCSPKLFSSPRRIRQPEKSGAKLKNHHNIDPTSTKLGAGRDKSEKPPYTYICLIAKAIQAQPNKKATLAEIYQYLVEHYDFFRGKYTGWKNSIRHNLSIGGCFKKLPKEGSNGSSSNKVGKGHKWVLGPELAADGRMNRKNRLVPIAETVDCNSKLVKSSKGFSKKKHIKSNPTVILNNTTDDGLPHSGECSGLNSWSADYLLQPSSRHQIYPMPVADWHSEQANNAISIPSLSALPTEQYLPAIMQPTAYEYVENTFPVINPMTSGYWNISSDAIQSYSQQHHPSPFGNYQTSQTVSLPLKLEEEIENKLSSLLPDELNSAENVQQNNQNDQGAETVEKTINNSYVVCPQNNSTEYDNYHHISAFSFCGSSQAYAYPCPSSEINYSSSDLCWASHESSVFYPYTAAVQNDYSAEDQVIINEENHCGLY